jgi:hypothetical protein
MVERKEGRVVELILQEQVSVPPEEGRAKSMVKVLEEACAIAPPRERNHIDRIPSAPKRVHKHPVIEEAA